MFSLFGLSDKPVASEDAAIPSHAPPLRALESPPVLTPEKFSFDSMVGLGNYERIVVDIHDSFSITEAVFASYTGLYRSGVLRYRANLVGFRLFPSTYVEPTLKCNREHLDSHVCSTCDREHVDEHDELHVWVEGCLPCTLDHVVVPGVCNHDDVKCLDNHWPDNAILIELSDYESCPEDQAPFRWSLGKLFMKFDTKWRPISGVISDAPSDGYYRLIRSQFVDV